MTNGQKDPKYPEFKKEFWKWFDSLPWHKKRMFWYYYDDFAETNFYFTVWRKKRKENDF